MQRLQLRTGAVFQFPEASSAARANGNNFFFFPMTKQAQLSINTIIVAVIALVVLVILIAIFTGRLAQFRTGIAEQQERGVSLQEYFEGFGCQQDSNACKDISENDCESSGCALNAERKCVGESSLCQSAGKTRCDELANANLCHWVKPPPRS